MTPRRIALALAAGLALADSSIVTLALPELLADFSTTVEGVAAVIGVYTVVLAATLIPAERLMRTFGPRSVGAGGFALFAGASLACGLAGSLPALLTFRGVQAVGGAAGLVAAFALLTGKGHDGLSARSLWLGVAVLSAAIGPALGGALTQLFSWQAIFFAQVPLAGLAVIAAGGAPEPKPAPDTRPEGRSWIAGIALALVSAALTAVLFLLVLLLVAGWGVEPLRAAVAVTVLPLAALAGSRIGGPARIRAATGCLLVGGGTIALAFLPDANLGWTIAPQVVAGLGMGLALPALGGELLPERDAADAAWLLTMRHAGIAVALVLLAPITADRLDAATERARERGVALVLDAQLPPTDKLSLAPDLLSGVEAEQPRAGLMDALDAQADRYDAGTEERAVLERLGVRADDTLVAAVGESFLAAFLITGALAILGGLLLLPGARRPGWAAVAIAVGGAAIAFTAVERARVAPEKVAIQDPCEERALPDSEGLTGFLQDRALQQIDKSACKIGATREEYVLALADPAAADAFQERYGVDPRSTQGILDALLG
ncbi:MAG: MFS transporter [Solirubrobacterales bacterium]|nr:MFS transporter [Solirubrobacterales bacterium]